MKGQRYMLDTHTSSDIIKGNSAAIRERLCNVPMAAICISAITEAELLGGVAKKPEAKYLPVAVKEFLLRVEILPWDSEAAAVYTQLQSASTRESKSLSTMDRLIAAHSIAADAVLVTNGKSFHKVEHHLTLEDWTQSSGH
jgi:tRNA(fMet)-specific endonuclease VapC